MRKLSSILPFLLVYLLAPVRIFAAGDVPDAVVIVTDTRKLHGWEAWWANLYNESHVLFALVTIIIIPVCGVILGVLADLVMSRLGIDLRNRALAEH
jgi:hypothetical protein